MKRREFLTRLFCVPLTCYIPFKLTEKSKATEYLYEAWVKFYKTYKQFPKVMLVSQELFNAFNNELVACERFSAGAFETNNKPTLRFKSTIVYSSASLRNWEYTIG